MCFPLVPRVRQIIIIIIKKKRIKNLKKQERKQGNVLSILSVLVWLELAMCLLEVNHLLALEEVLGQLRGLG